jgi:hypothetical protein
MWSVPRAEPPGLKPRGEGTLKAALRVLLLQFAIVVAVLAGLELVLRAIDLRYLRQSAHVGQAAVYGYDADLGWSPVPGSRSAFFGSRTIAVRHNSLGLRDIEPGATAKPVMLFLGDSLTWGYDVEETERFTDILRQRLPGFTIVNAGVSGYGTDQEYILLQRLWPVVKPSVVVLIVCTDNDRQDNMSNRRNDFYKPYFVADGDGRLQLHGQPVPKPRQLYFREDPLAHYSWVVRVLVSAYIVLRHPRLSVPDPTEGLIAMIRARVESGGARFFVGLQGHDAGLESFLRHERIGYASFEDAERSPADALHWTPKGHTTVADHLMSLFADAGIAAPVPAASQ